MVKYLGEQGQSDNNNSGGDNNNNSNIIKAAVSLGNPSVIDSRNASAVYSPLIAAGLKRTVWNNRSAWSTMARLDHGFRRQLQQLLTFTWSLAHFDTVASPLFLRNDTDHATRLGYAAHGGPEQYWSDSSSYRYVPYITVPLLHVYALNDHLVAPGNRRIALRYYLANPHVMVVETPVGGHLGWQETQGDNYAVYLVLEFLKSVLSSPSSSTTTTTPAASMEPPPPLLLSKL
jgi:predicted alpha/beta-fold hydrolase